MRSRPHVGDSGQSTDPLGQRRSGVDRRPYAPTQSRKNGGSVGLGVQHSEPSDKPAREERPGSRSSRRNELVDRALLDVGKPSPVEVQLRPSPHDSSSTDGLGSLTCPTTSERELALRRSYRCLSPRTALWDPQCRTSCNWSGSRSASSRRRFGSCVRRCWRGRCRNLGSPGHRCRR
jgi:hypothetical protein